MTRELTSISDLPGAPAVYAMYGGQGRRAYVAYIGVGGNLRQRVMQHLVRRDSSVATGTSAAALNPDYVTRVQWWEHPDFAKRHILEAAELVAFDVLDPALRSRGGIPGQAKELYADDRFHEEMASLFGGEPTGCLVIPTLQDALEQIAELEQRVTALEERLREAKAE